MTDPARQPDLDRLRAEESRLRDHLAGIDDEGGTYHNGLALVLVDLDAIVHDRRLLTEATQLGQDALRLGREDTVDYGRYFRNLAITYLMLVERYGDTRYLPSAARLAEMSIGEPSADDGEAAYRLLLLAQLLRDCARHLDEQAADVLGSALQHGRAAVLLLPVGSRERLDVEGDVGLTLRELFQITKDPVLVDEAVAIARTRAEECRDYVAFNALAQVLLTRYENDGEPSDLAEAAEAGRLAVAAIPPGAVNARVHAQLGHIELARAQQSPELLPAAIAAYQQAVDLCRAGHPDLPGHLTNLGHALLLQAGVSGFGEDLDRAVDSHQRALDLAPTDSPHQVSLLSNLGSALSTRYEWQGSAADLAEAVRLGRAAVACAGAASARLAGLQANLAGLLRMECERLPQPELLVEARDLAAAAVAATDRAHPARTSRLMILAQCRHLEFLSSDDLSAGQDAAELGREAVAAVETGDLSWPRFATSLSTILRARYIRVGDFPALLEAAQLSRAAAAAVAAPHSESWFYQRMLASVLMELAAATGSGDTLRAAASAARHAAVGSGGHPLHVRCLCTAVTVLNVLYRREGDRDVLVESVELGRAAVAAAPEGHPVRPAAMSLLATALQEWYRQTKETAALHEAILLAFTSQQDYPPDHQDRPFVLSNLAAFLHLEFQREPDEQVLEHAAGFARQALQMCPSDHPQRAVAASTLAGILRLSGVMGAEAAAFYLTAAADGRTPRWVRARALRGGGRALLSSDPPGALDAFRLAVDELNQVVPQRMQRDDREFRLGDLQGLAGDVAAAAVQCGDPRLAVELLEQARGKLLDDRIARDEMEAVLGRLPADLAAAFRGRESELGYVEDLLSGVGFDLLESHDDLLVRRDRLRQALADCTEEIRTRGFSGFLRPKTLEELIAAVDGTVVVININWLRCDAFLVSGPDLAIRHVPLGITAREVIDRANQLLEAAGPRPLPITDWAELWDRNEGLVELLRWEWEEVAAPVLDALALEPAAEDRTPPRIWWCPVGPAAFLPWHAASGGTSGAAVLDRAISSYTPTIRALAHARRARSAAGSVRGTLLVPSDDLVFAPEETGRVRRWVPSDGLTILPPGATTAAEVMVALREHAHAHFICHAVGDWADPADGRLLLGADKHHSLAVRELADLRLPDAEIAYLASCETARANQHLADEAVHLGAAFLQAGFRQVAATLWDAEDGLCVELADTVYAHLTGGGAGAVSPDLLPGALHLAINKLRLAHPREVLRWAGFIHIGA